VGVSGFCGERLASLARQIRLEGALGESRNGQDFGPSRAGAENRAERKRKGVGGGWVWM
jgi:ribosomal protein S19E (S16A)